MPAPVSIMITTHNRRADLERTLAALGTLNPGPAEILVCADGCTDGTADYLKSSHPEIILLENTPGLGSVASRDMMLRIASQPIVLSLDDDSHPVETDFLAKLDQLFAANPQVGIITFPQRSDEFPDSLTTTGFGPDTLVASYANSGAAVGREVYLSLPGYPHFFFHAYEEPDLALQMLEAGYDTLFHTGLTIRHYWTPAERNEMRIHHRHARNECWSILLRCPMPWMLVLPFYRVIRQKMYAIKRGTDWLINEPRWWWDCLKGIPNALKYRKPVSWKTYRKWLQRMSRPEPK